MPRSLKNLLLIICCAFQSFLHAQYSPLDLDSLCLLSETAQWRPLVLKLNRIWKATPDSAFVKSNFSEGLFWIKWMYLQKASRTDLRRGYMYFAHRIKKTENLSLASQYYLIAHQLVDDPFCLDSDSWYIENELATYYNRTDDLEESLYYYQLLINSLEYYEKFENLSRAYTNLSTLYMTNNNLDKAREYAQKGYNLAINHRLPQGLVANAAQFAEVLFYMDSLQRVKILLKIADKARSNAPSDNFEENKYIVHKMLAKYYTKTGNWKKADYYFASAGKLEDMQSIMPRDRAKLYNDWSIMLLDKGDTLRCREKLILGLKEFWKSLTKLELESPVDSVHIDNTYAELFSSISDYFYFRYSREKKTELLKMSLRYLQWALFRYAQIQKQIMTDPSKLEIIRHNRQLADQGIERLYAWQQVSDSEEELFPTMRAFFTAAKGRLLHEKEITHRIVEKFNHAEQKRFQELQRQAWWWMEQVGKFTDDEAFIRSEILKIKRTKSRMLNQETEYSLEYIFPNQYLEYHIGPQAVYVTGKINGQVLFKRLGSKSKLDSLMSHCQKSFASASTSDYQKVLKAMAKYLLPGEYSSLPEGLCIIPDGSLQQFPFEALILADGSYLFEKTRIWYEHAYGTLKENATTLSKNERLLVIWPQYPPAPEVDLLAQRGSAYALPHTQEEINGIRSSMGSKVIVDTSSDLRHLMHSMLNADILHYAGHARSDGDYAYWVLPGKNNRLSLEVLSEFYQPMQLVVLSACETGLGSWEYGEGLRSLGKSFREAGTQTVIMSLWAVNDQSTAIIMKQFYQGLKNGKSINASLQAAKLKYLQNASLEKKHPYFWAGFVGYGDVHETNN